MPNTPLVNVILQYEVSSSKFLLLSFFSDFIILPGFIDFTADEVVSYFQIFFIRVESLAVTSLWCKEEPIWTQGGLLWISNSGDDRMGAKIKPKKLP